MSRRKKHGGPAARDRARDLHAEARQVADRNIRAGHHYQEDVACIACGTDSTVGCIVVLGGGDA